MQRLSDRPVRRAGPELPDRSMVTQDTALCQGIWSQWLMTCSGPGAPDGATRTVWGTGPGAIGHPGPKTMVAEDRG
jgi:hypothetical protein